MDTRSPSWGMFLPEAKEGTGNVVALTSPLSEPGCCQLRMVHPISSKLPTPSSGYGKVPALPTMLLAPYHIPVASRTPSTRLPRDRGNGGSRSREGSRPARRWSLGLNFVYSDPELQMRQRPSFPLASLICFGNFS